MMKENIEPFVLSDSIGYFFSGTIMLLLFLVLIVYIKTRERIYLHYTLFLFFILLYAFTGLKEIVGFDHILLDYLHSNRRYVEPVTILSFSFYIFFAIKLVNIDTQCARLARSLYIFGCSSVLYSLLYFALFDFISAHHLEIFIVTRILIFSLCSFFLYKIHKRIQSPIKLFFMLGSLFYFVGSIVASLRFSGVHVSLDTFYMLNAPAYFQLGIMLQALFFALALGERVVFLHQEHDFAQRILIEQLAVKEQVTKEVNARLEKEIDERLREILIIKEDLQKQERMRMMAEFERNLIRAEITAKRAQINPHFMFNSLNAIKYLIMQGENDKANKYLTMFSRFIRSVLERVDKDMIPFEMEIAILQDYLKLEKKRFEDDFVFDIVVEPDLTWEDYQLPPLLLQPFAENAIWHGLLTSDKAEKKLTIAIQSIYKGIKISIEDNGVGRLQTLSKNAKKAHKSKGGALTKQRIDLFNLNNKHRRISMTIIDLQEEDEKKTPRGTRVELLYEILNKSHIKTSYDESSNSG